MPHRVLELARVRQLVSSGEARAIRCAAGVSQGEVAAAVGVEPPTISRWERGLRQPRGGAAIRYLRILDRLGS